MIRPGHGSRVLPQAAKLFGWRSQAGAFDMLNDTLALVAECLVPVPQFTEVTAKTNTQFNHISSTGNRYVVESMSGGVLLIDYDRDGCPDIYITNASPAGSTR